MNVENHFQLSIIHQFADLSNAFDDTLTFENDRILFKPFDDAWSIVEQIVHCVDFDVANFQRYRRAIVSPGTRVLPFDRTWTSALNYQSSDISSAINVIKVVRKFMASHFITIVNDDWSKYVYAFSDDKRFNLEEAIKHYINHVGFHRELIDRNIKLFSEANKH